jgi:hypothetical protein
MFDEKIYEITAEPFDTDIKKSSFSDMIFGISP